MVDEVLDGEVGKEMVGVVNFNQGNILQYPLVKVGSHFFQIFWEEFIGWDMVESWLGMVKFDFFQIG